VACVASRLLVKDSVQALKYSRRITSASGFSLAEVSVATALVGLFVSALVLMGSNLLSVLRSTKENANASQLLQERVEQLRIGNWLQITDASLVASKFLAADADSAGGFTLPVETVTIEAYPPNGTPAARIVRKNHNTVVVVANPNLKNERMVRVDVNLSWLGTPNQRPRSRATSTLIAKGGTSK
jgi:Tfp pilus assembly protein PilV